MEPEALEREAQSAIAGAATADELNEVRVRYLGRKSELKQALRTVRDRETGMALNAARVALERMARELREAGYDPASVGIEAVVVAEPARVVFQRDLNGNGVIDPTRERVTYLLRAGESTLRRDAGGRAIAVCGAARRSHATSVSAGRCASRYSHHHCRRRQGRNLDAGREEAAR